MIEPANAVRQVGSLVLRPTVTVTFLDLDQRSVIAKALRYESSAVIKVHEESFREKFPLD